MSHNEKMCHVRHFWRNTSTESAPARAAMRGAEIFQHMNWTQSSDNPSAADKGNHTGWKPTNPPSDTTPIPYLPGLKQILPNVTCAVLVTYLEMRFPAPSDDPKRQASLPVTVSVDTVSRELAISRRTLGLSLYAIARVYREEAER